MFVNFAHLHINLVLLVSFKEPHGVHPSFDLFDLRFVHLFCHHVCDLPIFSIRKIVTNYMVYVLYYIINRFVNLFCSWLN